MTEEQSKDSRLENCSYDLRAELARIMKVHISNSASGSDEEYWGEYCVLVKSFRETKKEERHTGMVMIPW